MSKRDDVIPFNRKKKTVCTGGLCVCVALLCEHVSLLLAKGNIKTRIMVNCAAIGCVNRSTTNPHVSFHKIPSLKEETRRKKWIVNIRREGTLPKDVSFYICSEHFEETCF